MAWTKKETELAKVVVDELRARGWTVYQEPRRWCRSPWPMVAGARRAT